MSGKELSLYDAFLAVFKAFLFKTTGSDFMSLAGYTLLKIGSKHLKYIVMCIAVWSIFCQLLKVMKKGRSLAKYVKKKQQGMEEKRRRFGQWDLLLQPPFN